MSPRIVNWIYTAVVKPMLLYGLALHIDSPKQSTANVAFCISGALRTTPNEAERGLEPP